MKYILAFIFIFFCVKADAQHSIRLAIKSSESNQPLPAASVTISSLKLSAAADSSGLIIFTNIPEGTHRIKVSHVGLKEKEISLKVPQAENTIVEIVLE